MVSLPDAAMARTCCRIGPEPWYEKAFGLPTSTPQHHVGAAAANAGSSTAPSPRSLKLFPARRSLNPYVIQKVDRCSRTGQQSWVSVIAGTVRRSRMPPHSQPRGRADVPVNHDEEVLYR
jgi:hypothetical protein